MDAAEIVSGPRVRGETSDVARDDHHGDFHCLPLPETLSKEQFGASRLSFSQSPGPLTGRTVRHVARHDTVEVIARLSHSTDEMVEGIPGIVVTARR